MVIRHGSLFISTCMLIIATHASRAWNSTVTLATVRYRSCQNEGDGRFPGRSHSVFPLPAVCATEGYPVTLSPRALALHDWNGGRTWWTATDECDGDCCICCRGSGECRVQSGDWTELRGSSSRSVSVVLHRTSSQGDAKSARG